MSEPKHGEITHMQGETRIGTLQSERPIITSRVTYVSDLAEVSSIECEITLRSGAHASATLNPKQIRAEAPPEFWRRVEMVHTALMLWGVGDARWHQRDVGKCACMLLAMMLPADDGPFRSALTSPERVAGYLTAPK